PVFDYVLKELLRPQQTSVGLAHHLAGFWPESRWQAGSIEVVCFTAALHHHMVKVRPEHGCPGLVLGIETQSETHCAVGWHVDTVIKGRLGAACCRLHCGGLAMHHIRMKGVFDVGSGVRKAEQPLSIRFVLGKQARWRISDRQRLSLEIKTSE